VTPPLRSSLLVGHVMHRRLSPFGHAFRYPIYMHRLDVDELPLLDGRLRLLGVGRARPVRFRASDHLDGRDVPARAAVEALLAAHGVAGPFERIELVTNCRVLGYVFNPVSFWFCHAAGGALRAVVAEVNNTFGERHCYVLPAAGQAQPGVWRDKKVFHVSPFLSLDGTYRFEFEVGEAHLDVRIDLHRDGRPVFVSRLALDRRPLTDGALLRQLATRPLVTLQVIAAIHWEALRLWMKGAAYHPKPEYDPGAARVTRA
jgi:DUF1365 family protein